MFCELTDVFFYNSRTIWAISCQNCDFTNLQLKSNFICADMTAGVLLYQVEKLPAGLEIKVARDVK